MAHKGRPAGGERPFFEAIYSKLDWHRKTQRWSIVTRIIDRRRGSYDELIIDRETGDVVREVHEPLSQHRGRGSARRP